MKFFGQLRRHILHTVNGQVNILAQQGLLNLFYK